MLLMAACGGKGGLSASAPAKYPLHKVWDSGQLIPSQWRVSNDIERCHLVEYVLKITGL